MISTPEDLHASSLSQTASRYERRASHGVAVPLMQCCHNFVISMGGGCVAIDFYISLWQVGSS